MGKLEEIPGWGSECRHRCSARRLKLGGGTHEPVTTSSRPPQAKALHRSSKQLRLGDSERGVGSLRRNPVPYTGGLVRLILSLFNAFKSGFGRSTNGGRLA